MFKIFSRTTFVATLILTIILTMTACSHSAKDTKKAGSPVYYALAVMSPTSGNKTRGTIWFSEGFGKVKVEAEISGLDINSKHGFHIHEFGDCSATDGSSAGGHYNPEGGVHGSHDHSLKGAHHVGDMGNLVSDKSGKAKLVIEIEGMSLSGSLSPIVGRGVIIHKNADDLISQPTGGAGARIACGVIGAATK